jgi:tetratricopeptide (TPR) repeat protein
MIRFALFLWLSLTLTAQERPRKPLLDIGAEQAPLSQQDKSELAAAIDAHDYAREKTLIDRIAAAHPDSPELLVMTGRLAFLEKHPKDAADALERANQLKPLAENDRLTLALSYEFAGQSVEAHAELEKLSKSAPKNAEYYYLLGRIDRQNGQLKDAIAEFRKAIDADQGFMRSYRDLGQCLESLGQNDDARRTYQLAAFRNRYQMHPSESAPLDYGAFLLKANELSAAQQQFEDALRYNPRSSWAHYYLGQVFQAQGKHEAAIREYQEAVVDNPTHKDSWLALAGAYKKLGRKSEADKALAIFEKLNAQQETLKNKAG